MSSKMVQLVNHHLLRNAQQASSSRFITQWRPTLVYIHSQYLCSVTWSNIWPQKLKKKKSADWFKPTVINNHKQLYISFYVSIVLISS